MWLVLAHEGDSAAHALANGWGERAVLVTPAALHRHRWRLEVGRRGTARPSLGGVEVDGVVTRLGAVTEAELPHVIPEDRAYVSAELTAFLLAWLDACSCPVLNRPVAGSLNGPPWGPLHWSVAAARAGLAVAPRTRHGLPGDPGRCREVRLAVVGDACIGPASVDVADRLRGVAQAAGVSLLEAVLDGDGDGSGARVTALSAWPDVGDARVAAALSALLEAAAC